MKRDPNLTYDKVQYARRTQAQRTHVIERMEADGLWHVAKVMTGNITKAEKVFLNMQTQSEHLLRLTHG